MQNWRMDRQTDRPTNRQADFIGPSVGQGSNNCAYYKAGYIIPCSSFSFKLTNGKNVSWTYKNYFSSDSKDVLIL